MEPADKYIRALNESRLLVFLECEDMEDCDHSDGLGHHFHQILLTERQFKRVSDAVITESKIDLTLKEGYELASLRMGNPVIASPFEGLSSTL